MMMQHNFSLPDALFVATVMLVGFLLSRHTGKVLTYATIIREIWGGMDDGSVKNSR